MRIACGDAGFVPRARREEQPCWGHQSFAVMVPKKLAPVFRLKYATGAAKLSGSLSNLEKLRCRRETTTPIAILSIPSLMPPEWAYVTSRRKGVAVTQGSARTIDRNVRMRPLEPLKCGSLTRNRLNAMLDVACDLMEEGCPPPNGNTIHRLQKADTAGGLKSIKSLARIGAPYAMLLYERFLGRPFAGHRDSVSQLVGDPLELAIEDVLTKEGISYRKTRRAERVSGFDQAPDFIVPDEFNTQVVIEAKLTEDDGTARDKVTRIQHLGQLSLMGAPAGRQKYQVIACIAGRGFAVRREDMKKMLLATRGKVFTLKTLGRLVECSDLAKFATKAS